MAAPQAVLDAPQVSVYRVPTDAPEADGTIAWDATTLVVVEIAAGGERGLGYTYASKAAGTVVEDVLAGVVTGADALDISGLWIAMARAVRNIGWPGIAAHAVSAVDAALWDLKAKLLGLPLVRLLGPERDRVPIYGSGGFITYADERLEEQFGRWTEQDGCRAVKMKIAGDATADVRRMRVARGAIGNAELYIDANGAMTPKPALAMAEAASGFGVTWFEEPVSSDDLAGLRLLCEQGPAGMDIVAGEYGYNPYYFRRMLEEGAVDVLQADATRCGGLTGFRKAAELADAFMRPLSAHTAPALHLHAACAVPRFKNIEWFHDHVRIEEMVFDGAPRPREGFIAPDFSRPGIGIELKKADASRFAV